MVPNSIFPKLSKNTILKLRAENYFCHSQPTITTHHCILLPDQTQVTLFYQSVGHIFYYFRTIWLVPRTLKLIFLHHKSGGGVEHDLVGLFQTRKKPLFKESLEKIELWMNFQNLVKLKAALTLRCFDYVIVSGAFSKFTWTFVKSVIKLICKFILETL